MAIVCFRLFTVSPLPPCCFSTRPSCQRCMPRFAFFETSPWLLRSRPQRKRGGTRCVIRSPAGGGTACRKRSLRCYGAGACAERCDGQLKVRRRPSIIAIARCAADGRAGRSPGSPGSRAMPSNGRARRPPTARRRSRSARTAAAAAHRCRWRTIPEQTWHLRSAASTRQKWPRRATTMASRAAQVGRYRLRPCWQGDAGTVVTATVRLPAFASRLRPRV